MRKPTMPPELIASTATEESLDQSTQRLKSALDALERPDVLALIDRANKSYWSWDELRRRPMPGDLSAETVWHAVKLSRPRRRRIAGLVDASDRPFAFVLTDAVAAELHCNDLEIGGTIGAGSDQFREQRDRYVLRSLTEEAIASSQLEGASTTRKVARELLKTGRKPRTTSERMILNNYQTISWLRDQKDRPLSPDFIFDIHRRVTAGTFQGDGDSGRLRRADENILVVDARDNEVMHVPPPAAQLPKRLERMCEFANAADSDGGFIHPVVRAIILHFWLAYDHPFVDGNGRTARALFYWYMLRRRYWMFEFLSISRMIQSAPSRYQLAFQNTETDDNDLTFFVVFNLDLIGRARKELARYLEEDERRIKNAQTLLKAHRGLNHRQQALLAHALMHADAVYTIESHRGSHGIAYDTARLDLADLTHRGLLTEYKAGRKLQYSPSAKVLRKSNAGRARRRKGSAGDAG